MRLDRCAWCYRPDEGLDEPDDPPALRNGFVTFGSFNRMAKITPPVAAKIHMPDPELGDSSTEEAAEDGAESPKPKKKTRRGSRGGRRRKKPAGAAASAAATDGEGPKIHLPDPELGRVEEEEEQQPAQAPAPETASEDGAEAAKPKKKTRRGSRGGRRRRKSGTAKPASTPSE